MIIQNTSGAAARPGRGGSLKCSLLPAAARATGRRQRRQLLLPAAAREPSAGALRRVVCGAPRGPAEESLAAITGVVQTAGAHDDEELKPATNPKSRVRSQHRHRPPPHEGGSPRAMLSCSSQASRLLFLVATELRRRVSCDTQWLLLPISLLSLALIFSVAGALSAAQEFRRSTAHALATTPRSCCGLFAAERGGEGQCCSGAVDAPCPPPLAGSDGRPRGLTQRPLGHARGHHPRVRRALLLFQIHARGAGLPPARCCVDGLQAASPHGRIDFFWRSDRELTYSPFGFPAGGGDVRGGAGHDGAEHRGEPRALAPPRRRCLGDGGGGPLAREGASALGSEGPQDRRRDLEKSRRGGQAPAPPPRR